MFEFVPIGYFRCSRDYHQEQPMQGVFSEAEGYVELLKGFNYEQGLKDIDGFDHLWVFFIFHHNKNWKPLTNPPYNDGNGKKGVFASRSPYRPNPLGMSCVRLEKIAGNRIYVSGADLLNNSPVVDIKPYIVEYDSFPAARRGWLDNICKEVYAILYSAAAAEKIAFLAAKKIDLSGVISSQLGHNPHDHTRNKFQRRDDYFVLRFKSWRIHFTIADREIRVEDIRSGYTGFSMTLGNDTATDLEIHREFRCRFPD